MHEAKLCCTGSCFIHVWKFASMWTPPIESLQTNEMYRPFSCWLNFE